MVGVQAKVTAALALPYQAIMFLPLDIAPIHHSFRVQFAAPARGKYSDSPQGWRTSGCEMASSSS